MDQYANKYKQYASVSENKMQKASEALAKNVKNMQNMQKNMTDMHDMPVQHTTLRKICKKTCKQNGKIMMYKIIRKICDFSILGLSF